MTAWTLPGPTPKMKHDSVGGLYSVVQAAASPVQGAVWRSFGAVNTDDQGAGGKELWIPSFVPTRTGRGRRAHVGVFE